MTQIPDIDLNVKVLETAELYSAIAEELSEEIPDNLTLFAELLKNDNPTNP